MTGWLVAYTLMLAFHAEDFLGGVRGQQYGELLTHLFHPAVLVVLGIQTMILGTVVLGPNGLLHGLAIRYYGEEARYGVGIAHFILPYAYATTDHEFSRN